MEEKPDPQPTEAEPELDEKLKGAIDREEFWKVSCFHAYATLVKIARGGDGKNGLMSARSAMRIARNVIREFDEAMEEEKLNTLRAGAADARINVGR
jgi:hypothetical protein